MQLVIDIGPLCFVDIQQPIRGRLPVAEVIPRVDTDLVTLTRECSELLNRIRKVYKEEIGMQDKLANVEKDYVNQWPCKTAEANIHTVLQTMAEVTENLERWTSAKSRAKYIGTKMTLMDISSRVMRQFIREIKNGRVVVEPLEPHCNCGMSDDTLESS